MAEDRLLFTSSNLEDPGEPAMRASEAHSSLDESNFELLSTSGILSDDEGNTVSVASQSVDGDTPDDFSSINDTEGSEVEQPDEDEEEEHYVEETPSIPHVHTPSGIEGSGIDESAMTTRPVSLDFIEFHEEPQLDGQLLTHPLPGTAGLGSTVIKLAASNEVVQLPHRFRVLFVGDLYSYTGDFLIEHIAQALMAFRAANSGRGSFSVTAVPTATSPQTFEITPSSGVEIQIDHCVEAKGSSRLILEDGSELRFQKGQMERLTHEHTESSDLPHLAVFLHTEQPRRLQDNATVRFVHMVALQNRIPTLDVATSGCFEPQPGFNPSRGFEMHMTTEHSDAPSNPLSPIPKGYMPIDIQWFSKISPADLSRHLAFLMNHTEDPNGPTPVISVQGTQASSSATVLGEKLRELSQSAYESIMPVVHRLWITARFEQKAAILGLLIMMILPILLAPFVTLSSNQTVAPQTPAPPTLQPVATSTASTTSTWTSSRVDLAQVVTNVVQMDTSQVVSLGRPQARLESKLDTASEKFTAERISSTVFSVTPPSFLTNSRKFSPSAVTIKIRRGSEPVPFKLVTMTKPNVGFAVELEPQDAHGLLSVLISVNGKPKIVENLTVDFGNGWLGAPTWTKAFDFICKTVRDHVEQTEMNFKALSDQLSQYLQKVRDESEELRFLASNKSSRVASKALKDIRASTKALIKQANNDIKELSKHIQRELKVQQRTTKKMLQRSNELAKRGVETMDLVRREVAETCVENLKAFADMVQNVDLTGPVRGSKVLKNAARNAKKLVNKVTSNVKKDDEKPRKCKDRKRAAKTATKAKKQETSATRKRPFARGPAMGGPRDDAWHRF